MAGGSRRSSRRDPRRPVPSPTGSAATAPGRTRPPGAARARLGPPGPGPHQTPWGGTRLDDLSIADVRRHVVVSEPDPRLFTGVLREQLRGDGGHAADREVLAALTTASALDVLDAVPDGLDGTVEERGRSYSGGQRQRLALSRA